MTFSMIRQSFVKSIGVFSARGRTFSKTKSVGIELMSSVLQHTSYSGSWFHLLVYGNIIHVAGYMVLSAWIAAILERLVVKKSTR